MLPPPGRHFSNRTAIGHLPQVNPVGASPRAARSSTVGAAARGGRRLVVAMMYGLVHQGGPTYWDQAGGLLDWGFALNPQSAIGAL